MVYVPFLVMHCAARNVFPKDFGMTQNFRKNDEIFRKTLAACMYFNFFGPARGSRTWTGALAIRVIILNDS